MAGLFAKATNRKRMCDMDERHGESSVVVNLPGGRSIRICTACAKVLGHRVN